VDVQLGSRVWDIQVLNVSLNITYIASIDIQIEPDMSAYRRVNLGATHLSSSTIDTTSSFGRVSLDVRLIPRIEVILTPMNEFLSSKI